MEDIILQISARRESALEDSDANLAALLFNVLGLIGELQLDVQKWQISVNQGNEIIKELEAKLAIATSALDEINFHEGRYIKNSKEEITLYFKITKEALEKIK